MAACTQWADEGVRPCGGGVAAFGTPARACTQVGPRERTDDLPLPHGNGPLREQKSQWPATGSPPLLPQWNP